MCKSILAFLFLFSYLYGVGFRSFPLDSEMILSIISVCYLIGIRKTIHAEMRRMLALSLFFVVAGICVTVLNMAFDFSFIKVLAKVFLYPVNALFVVDVIVKSTKRFSEYSVLEWCVYAGLLQAVISFIFFFYQPLREAFISNIASYDEEFLSIQGTIRLVAFSKYQYANMAVSYGVILMFAVTLAFEKNMNISRHKILYTLMIIMLVTAGIMSGRTYFLMLLIIFFYYALLCFYQKGWKAIFRISLLCVVIVFSFFLCIDWFSGQENFSKSFNWVFEWYLNMNDSENSGVGSVSRLKEMYVLPESIKTWLIGNGRFLVEDGFYMHTDVGYLRNIYYWGLPLSLLFFLFQYRYCKITARQSVNRDIKTLCIIIFVWTLIYNIKEYYHAIMYWCLIFYGVVNAKNRVIH